MSILRFLNLGLLPYLDALKWQQYLHGGVVQKKLDPHVLFVEHPAVLTLGKNSDPKHLLASRSDLEQSGIELIQSDRGGQVTAHEPGQLVMYPILPVSSLGLSPKCYIETLEKSVIEVLGQWGIVSKTDPKFPGIWVGDQKICAVGVRIKQRVTMHGVALNVMNSLKTFNSIEPCGIKNRGITTMAQCLKRTDLSQKDLQKIQGLLANELSSKLGFQALQVDVTQRLQTLQQVSNMGSVGLDQSGGTSRPTLEANFDKTCSESIPNG